MAAFGDVSFGAEIEVGRDAGVDDSFAVTESSLRTSSRQAEKVTADDSLLPEPEINEMPYDASEQADMPNMDPFANDTMDLTVDHSLVGPDTPAFDAATPSFSGLDSTTRAPDPVEAVDISIVRPLQPLQPHSRRLALPRRRRKLVIDQSLEISSKEMRRRLEVDGCDDVSRQPYTEERSSFKFDLVPSSRSAMKQRHQDRAPEILLARAPGARKKLARPLKALYQRRMALGGMESLEPTTSEEVEVGREGQAEPEYEPEISSLFPTEQPPLDDTAIEPEPTLPDDYPTMDSTFADQSIVDFNGETSVLYEGDAEENPDSEAAAAHLTKRTLRMMHNLKTGFSTADSLQYNAMTAGKSRRTAAACLFEMLVLKTKDFIEVKQDKPFGDITVTPTDLLVR